MEQIHKILSEGRQDTWTVQRTERTRESLKKDITEQLIHVIHLDMSTTGNQSLGCIVVLPPLWNKDMTPCTFSSHRKSGVSCSASRIWLVHVLEEGQGDYREGREGDLNMHKIDYLVM
jgi:hypothetical protein